MRSNTAGTPDTRDYHLGRGIIYIAFLSSAGLPVGGYRDVGNATDFTVTCKADSLAHKSSRTGTNFNDKEQAIGQAQSFAFTLDECNMQNLALWTAGGVDSFTNPSIAGFSVISFVSTADLAAGSGKWFDIQNASGVRAYNTIAADVLIKTSNATPVTLVEGTDYTLDVLMGRVYLIPGSAVIATAVGLAEHLTIALTANASAGAVSRAKSQTGAPPRVAIKFVADNAADNDTKVEVQIHQAQLKADGDFAMIGDKWAEMKFTGTCEVNSNAAYVASPVMDVVRPLSQDA